MSCSLLCLVEGVGLKTDYSIHMSPDDDPLGSKHVGQFLCNKNHLCICWCMT